MTDEMQGDFLNTPIKQNDMVAFKQQRVCQNCKKGFMVATGLRTGSDSPVYQHECSRCNYEHVFREEYPRIVHQEKP